MDQDVKNPQATEATPDIEAAQPVETTTPTKEGGKETTPAQTEVSVAKEVADAGKPDEAASLAKAVHAEREMRKQERERRKQLEKRIAELESSTQLQGYDPNDLEAVMSHPYVQDLLIKDAKRELSDYAREELDRYPSFPEKVKKAILSNVRGFVGENTRDIELAKLEVREFIEQIAEEQEEPGQTAEPAAIKVASTNQSTVTPGARPSDIDAILRKPVDEMSDEEVALVEEYRRSLPKK